MELVTFTNIIVDLVASALGGDQSFKVGFSGVANEEAEHNEFIHGSVTIEFEFGNVKQEHVVAVGWSSDDGVGLLNHEGEILKLTTAAIFKDMYITLALQDLSDEFLQ